MALAEISNYELRVSTKVVNGDWLGLPVEHTEWVDTGNHYDCNAWQPDPTVVDFGQSYLQTRDCQQDQEREAIIKEEHSATGEVTEVRRVREQQTIIEEESQIATGVRRDWQGFESTFTNWVDFSGAHSHTSWSPSAGMQVADYTQGRNYLVTQERFEQKREQDLVTSDIRDVGEPIRHDRDDGRSENRPIDVSATNWTNTAAKVCGAWSPEPLAVDFGQNYTQTRTCDQDQARLWTHRDGETDIHTRNETRVNTFDETQDAVGERRDWQSFDSTFTGWVNVGARKNHTIWSPEIDLQMNDFGQSRDFQQDQQRIEQKREQDQVTNDIRNVGAPITHDQTIPGTENRNIVVTVSNWANSGAHYDCGVWAPPLDSVDFGEAFVQSRDCSQNQLRSRIYKAGGATVENITDPRTITETETQDVVGTYRNWEVTTSTFTDWENDGARRNYGAWTPVATAQTTGFSQSRTYLQDQDRYEQTREKDSVTGDIRNTGTPILHEQVINGNESRSVAVTWSTWTDVGGHKNCAAWGPLPNTVDFGESYIQTRDCDQDQTRNRIYKVGSNTINTVSENRTITETESQNTVGERRDWNAHASTFTEWLNDGARRNYSAWTPPATNQSAGFGQSRTYLQDQDRYEQKRERDSVTGDIRNVGGPVLHEQAIGGTENRTVSVAWSNWTDVGSHKNCAAWGVLPSTVDFGESYVQTRDCDQDQTRNRIYTSGGSNVNTVAENRTIKETESQPAVGERRDWVAHASTFTDWTNDGARRNYGSWTPGAATQTSGFGQSRTYLQDQDRYEQKRERDTVTGDIRTKGGPVLHEQVINGSETRTVAVSWSGWTNNGADQNCGTWGPLESTVNFGQSFTQTRSCDEPEKRSRIYKVGSTTINTVQETRLNTVERSQNATGTKRNWQATTSTFTNWVNSGGRHSHGAWSPAPSTQTSNFTQTRSYKQNQTRNEQKRERDSVTGDIRNTGSPIVRTQTLTNGTESQTVVVSWSNWTDSGAHKNCAAWGADPSTVNYGTAFTQTRICDQDQTRNRIYKAGSTTLHTAVESKTIKETESRAATGTKQVWQPTTSTFTNWVDTGSAHSYGSWTPAPTTQTSNYTQTRTYKFNQTRNEQKREKDAITGNIRNVGAEIAHSQTVNRSQNRTVAVSWGGWSNNGADQNCGTWGPLESTVNFGQSFTQTRSCDEPEKRSRIYKVGSTTINTVQETRLNGVARSQNATGTKRNWQPTDSTFTNWVNSGGRHSHGAWSPAPSTQTSNFTQTRSYKQNQTRNEQKRERDSVTGDIRNTGSPILRTQTLTNGTESQTVAVSWSNWTNSGVHKNCAAWGADPSTVNYGTAFTQTRICDQDQTRNRIYKAGSTTLHTAVEGKTIKETESRAATGTKQVWQPTTSSFTNWADSGSAHSHGSWTPAPTTQTSNYTQTRTYKVTQTRTEQKREKDAITGNIRNVGSPIAQSQADNRSQTRSVVVSWSNWTNNGADQSCGTWSPHVSTVGHGTAFTQTRTCNEPEKRNRIYKTGSTTLNTVVETRLNSVVRSQGATGTKRNWQPTTPVESNWANSGGRHSYTDWGPVASTQTSNYTQTRTYKQTQTRTVQQRERDSHSGQIRNVGSLVTESRTINGSDSRAITTTLGAWTNNGAPTNCSAWSPLAATQDEGTPFTQTQTCTQAQKQSRVHKAPGNDLIHTEVYSRSITITPTQTAYGTKPINNCRYSKTSPKTFISHSVTTGIVIDNKDYLTVNTEQRPPPQGMAVMIGTSENVMMTDDGRVWEKGRQMDYKGKDPNDKSSFAITYWEICEV